MDAKMSCYWCRRLCSVLVTFTLFSLSIAKPFESNVLSESDLSHYLSKRSLSDYELIAVTNQNRIKRSLDDQQTSIEYIISAFDKQIRLVLDEATSLFDGSLVVSSVGDDGNAKLSTPQGGCYYSGYTTEDGRSRAFISTCNGLSGSVRTEGETYQIQPLKVEHISKFGDVSSGDLPTHIISKRPTSTVACDTEGTREKSSNLRMKRDIGDPSFVEVSVTADDEVFAKHGDDTEQYVLSILNQVAGLFSEETLGVDINFVVSELIVLETPQKNLNLDDELSTTLKSFCKWQSNRTADISVLITGRNLQTGGNPLVTGKAADIGGACSPIRRCVVVQEQDSDELVLTLAHEIGHSLGMYHDDGLSDCANQGKIMSSTEAIGPYPYQWSPCSSKDLMQFIKSPAASCLGNQPSNFPVGSDEIVVLQGFYVDANQQCQKIFGEKAKVNPKVVNTQDICQQISCVVDGKVVVANNAPALNGTQCGNLKREMCLKESCVRAFSTQECAANPTNECVPEWIAEDWSPACSAPDNCIQTRNIFCVTFQDDGTIRLVVDLSRCPAERPATTQDCCTSTQFQYLALNFGECSVTCGDGIQTRLVICQDTQTGLTVDSSFCSGTPPSSTQQCVTGVACPGGSFALFTGAFGDCSVTCGSGVRTRQIVCVNEDNVQVPTAQCEAAGIDVPSASEVCSLTACPVEVNFQYIQGDFGPCSVTCGTGIMNRVVTCIDTMSGNTVSNVNCQNAGLVAPVSQLPCLLADCITYSYLTPEFPPCSITCGQTTVFRSVQCIDEESSPVAESFCDNAGLTKPAELFVCDLGDCPQFQFVAGEFSDCSATCGIGTQTRTVECQNIETNETVADSECMDTKPVEIQPCLLQNCEVEYEYIAGPYGTCTCEGIQTRAVICISRDGSNLNPAAESECTLRNLTKPETMRSCTAPDTCTGPVWETTEWSACSSTCGTGIQTRLVFCIENPGSSTIIPNAMCPVGEEPASVQPCDTEVACPPQYIWLATEFGDCSVTCGSGVRMRSVMCYAVTDTNMFTIVDNSECVPADEPESVEACTLEPCEGVYIATVWSPCSVTCGQGEQTRTVTCVRNKLSTTPIPEEDCIGDPPPETQACFLEACPSAIGCDTSFMASTTLSFLISSPNYPSNYPNDLSCLQVIRAPENHHVEVTVTDLELEEGCGFDTLVFKDVDEMTEEEICDASSVRSLPYTYVSAGPLVEVLLNTDVSITRRGFTGTFEAVSNDVLRFLSTNWTECDVTCGEGLQFRELICVLNDKEVDENDCSGLDKPATVRTCRLDACPQPGVCDTDVLRTEAGVITSPGFPDDYPANTTCSNLIRAPEGMVIRIIAQFVRMEAAPGCTKDALLISETGRRGAPLRFCGSLVSQDIFRSVTNEVRVTFVSDEDISESGFSISFEFVQPEATECGSTVTTSGQPITSPGYPAPYNNSESCTFTIQNPDGCIELHLTQLELAGPPDCSEDYLDIRDAINPMDRRLLACSRLDLFVPFISFSNEITIEFISDDNNTDNGFVAVPRFVECPSAVFVPSAWSPCSVTCSEGVERRVIECQNAMGQVVDDDMCSDLRPPSERPCVLPECPSCDRLVTQSNIIVAFPDDGSMQYSNNQDCEITIENPDGCITFVPVQLNVQLGTLEGVCNRDYIEIIDPAFPGLGVRYCGNLVANPIPNFRSVGSTLMVIFHSDESVTGSGFQFFPNFNSCPLFAYLPEPWGECSATCGGGIRSRDVLCRNLQTNDVVSNVVCGENSFPTEEPCAFEECPTCNMNVTESSLIVSPRAEGSTNYPNGSECEFFISNGGADCVSLSILDLELEEGEECPDYILFQDLDNPLLDLKQCAGEYPDVWLSSSNNVKLTFVSDDEVSAAGFSVFAAFMDCPAFAYSGSDFSPCSVTCGEGVQTRVVECRNVVTDAVVLDSLCMGPKPAETMPCSGGVEECPSCDASFTVSNTLIPSPNYPGDNYENNMRCKYSIYNPDGCIRLSFLVFDVDESDSLEISDDGYDVLDASFTGGVRPSPWLSRTGNVTLTFITDADVTEDGFNLFLQFVSCPTFGYVVTEFSGCDVTCGNGVQSRQVLCVRLMTGEDVAESFCNDPKPEATMQCSFPACPTCDQAIMESNVEITSPDYPMNYPANQECYYYANSTSDQCVSFFILSLDTEGPRNESVVLGEECDNDYLFYQDLDFPYRSRVLCGQSGAFDQPIVTYGQAGIIGFVSDNNTETGSGFRAFVTFIECPTAYAYDVGEFGECSRTCGDEAVRERSVVCVEIATRTAADPSLCNADEMPPELIPCEDLPECPSCDRYINESLTQVRSPNFPDPYSEYAECTYTINNPMGNCFRIAFVEFGLESDGSDCVDVLSISDSNYADNDPLELCGTRLPTVYHSLSPDVEATFTSNGNVSARGFDFFVIFEPCPPFAYISGPYGECSLTCGDTATKSRSVNCVFLSTGVEVEDNLCAGVKPDAVTFCDDLPECPNCDAQYTTAGELISTPNYPEDYSPEANCVYTVISNSGCVSLYFVEFELEERNATTGNCEGDQITILDISTTVPRTIEACGDELFEMEIISRGPNLIFSFMSDDNGVEAKGFNVFENFVPCPMYGYVANSVVPCSVTCGVGEETISVMCVRLQDEVEVDEALCQDAKPAETRRCTLPACPSCDEIINLDMQQFTSGFPDLLEENKECEYRLQSPTEQCWNIFFFQFNFPDAGPGGCDSDYILIEEEGEFGQEIRECGTRTVFDITTRYPRATITLVTDGDTTGEQGFQAQGFLTDCPMFGFVAGEFGNCSKACGGGEQTRTVRCVNLQTGAGFPASACSDVAPPTTLPCNVDPCPSCDQFYNTTGAVIRSPNYPLDYEPSQVCTFRVENPEGNCIRLTFTDFQLEDPNGMDVCNRDVLRIEDNAPFTEHLTGEFCGRNLPALFAWNSRSSGVSITLSTDANNEFSGFNLVASFQSCPPYGYIYSDQSACSATCGEGVITRNISCINLETMDEVADSFCPESPPEESVPCSMPPCPSCDSFVTMPGIITSPGYPMRYPNNAECLHQIKNMADECIQIIFSAIDIEQSDDCAADGVMIADAGNSQLNRAFCGNTLPPSWRSFSSDVNVTFYSNPTGRFMGFELNVVFVSCSDYSYVVQEIGMCSRTCGGGVQNRTVECQDEMGNVVLDDYCIDEKPESFVACNVEDCPRECNLVFSTDNPGPDLIQSPGFGFSKYDNNLNCVNNIINFQGCVVVTLGQLDVQEGTLPIMCDRDYVEISDPSFDEISERYCGSEQPTSVWRSFTSVVTIRLVSDGSVRGNGYSAFYAFSDTCPTLTFTATNFGACSATCGEGVQSRQVDCLDGMGNIVVDSSCGGARPPSVRACFPVLPLCPAYSWETGTYSDCDATCGVGTQTRNVTCVNELGDPANETLCIEMKPDETRSCDLPTCPPPMFSFVLGTFGACSVTCGNGTQVRTVTCEDDMGNAVNETLCDGMPPDTMQSCSGSNCFEYFTGTFSSCSVSCGGGTRNRLVQCRDVDGATATTADCDFEGLAMPASSEPCNEIDCPQFVVSNFTECMDTCGDEVQTRTVECFDSLNVQLALAACGTPVPATSQSCNLPSCENPNPQCGDVVGINTLMGNITSPNFPMNYPPNQNCLITFTGSADFLLDFQFTVIDLEFDAMCNGDFFRISGVATGSQTNVCTQLTPPLTWSSTPVDLNVEVLFVSNGADERQGFFGTFERIAINP